MTPELFEWLKKIAVFIVTAIIAAFIVMLLVSFFNGCMAAPKRANYIADECFTAMDCLYRCKDDKDKAVCSSLVEACRDCLKEKRAVARLEYCKDHCPAGMTEETCRLILNQR